MTPKLSIILLNYGNKNLIKQVVSWLSLQQFDFTYEIIIVNNDLGENFDGWQERYENLIIITSAKNGGYAFGNNLGVRNARGEYFLILNPDVVLFENSISSLLKYAGDNPRVGLCAPKLLNPDGSIQLSCRTWHSVKNILARRTPLALTQYGKRALHNHLVTDWDHGTSGPIHWAYGACLLIRKTAYDQIGGMDERYFLYFEDMDYCRTLWSCGWEVHYVVESEIVHYHHQDSAVWGGLRDIFRPSTLIHIKSGLKYLLKWRGQPLPEITPIWLNKSQLEIPFKTS